MTRHDRTGGFTLIELLVAITIMTFLFGTGIASYRRIERRQALLNACRKIEELALTAQKRARVGDRPLPTCLHLNSYRVSQVAASPYKVRLEALCTTASSPNAGFTIEDFTMDSRFTLTSMGTMTFRVLHGGLEEASSTITAQSTSPNYRCSFSADGGGSLAPITIVAY